MAKPPQRPQHQPHPHPQHQQRHDDDERKPQTQAQRTHRVDDNTPAVRDHERAAQQNPPTGAGQRDPNVQEPPPNQAEIDRDREPLDKAEAEQLLRAGTRLRIKGEDPANWIAMSRHGGDMVISYAATPEAIEEALENELIVADE